jgi:hypothetical protein
MLERLARLADEAQDEDDLFADPRWDELAAGEASEQTHDDLERLAEEAGMPEAMEAFAPLSSEAKARIQAAVDAIASPEVEREDRESEPPPESSPRVIRMRPVLVGLAAVVALAALLMLWWQPSDDRVAAHWPAYELTLGGGERPMRDDSGGPRVYRAGGELELSLRPERPVEEQPSLRAFVVGPERVLPLAGDVEIADSGAIRFRAGLPEELPDGALTLWLVIGRDADLPEASADRAMLSRLGMSLRVMTVPLPMAEEPAP